MRNENNRKRARKERGFLSGFVLVIHVQSGLDGGEFALVDQTSRGQRIAMKEVTACRWKTLKQNIALLGLLNQNYFSYCLIQIVTSSSRKLTSNTWPTHSAQGCDPIS